MIANGNDDGVLPGEELTRGAWLSEADVRAVLTMPDLIEAMQAALDRFSAGAADQPLRTVLQVGGGKAFFGVMPASVPARRAWVPSWSRSTRATPRAACPSHLATIVLLDPATGALLAIVDGRYITEARTAAVSAVSTRLLARPDAGVLAIIGSGVQARSHSRPGARPHAARRARVEPRRRPARGVRRSTRARPARVRAVGSAREAVDGADLVVLVSAARQPVVPSEWVDRRRAHLRRRRVPAGSAGDGHRAGARGRGCSWTRERQRWRKPATCCCRSPRERSTAAHIAGELGELAAGRVAGRTSPDQVTMFKSLGMAVEDVVAAHLAFERAAARGLGRPL